MRRTAALLAVAAACSSPARTPSTKPDHGVPLIPRAVMLGDPQRFNPVLSPDGTKVAYAAPAGGVLNVFVRDVAGGDERQVTTSEKQGITEFRWSPRGDEVLYVQDRGGDEQFHVWAAPASGGPARDLTPIATGQANIVAVEESVPGAILVAINDRDPQFHDVYRLDLATGERTIAFKNDIGAATWFADRSLVVRAITTFTPDGGFTLLHRPRADAPWTELVTWGPEDAFTSQPLAFSGDGKTLYVASSRGSNTVTLRAVDLATGAEKVISADERADLVDISAQPETRVVDLVSFERDRLAWRALDPSLEHDLTTLSGLHAGDFHIHGRSRDDRTWLVMYDQDRGSPAYFVYDRTDRKGTLLFTAKPVLDELPLAAMQPVTYKARDGLEIRAYLTLPVGLQPRALPAVMFIHGGPWGRDSWGYDGLTQFLANRGYAVLQPNFRGSTGFGKEFLNAADHEWGGKMQDDITDGTRWLIDQGIADPERICIMGGSYGGYATLMALAREPDLYACGIEFFGPANLITWLQTIPPYWKPYADILARRVGDPVREVDFLKSRSPVFLVDRIRAPLVIVQGANDPRVPKAESLQIRDALLAAGRTVEYLEFPDEGHGFSNPANRLELARRAEIFLARHIGGRYEE